MVINTLDTFLKDQETAAGACLPVNQQTSLIPDQTSLIPDQILANQKRHKAVTFASHMEVLKELQTGFGCRAYALNQKRIVHQILQYAQ